MGPSPRQPPAKTLDPGHCPWAPPSRGSAPRAGRERVSLPRGFSTHCLVSAFQKNLTFLGKNGSGISAAPLRPRLRMKR